MSDLRPIGVFDSGIGGLTVVKALRDLLPNENIFYLGDTARVPYGPKSPEAVQRYAIELGLLDDDVTDRMIMRYLEPMVADGIDTLVLGCTHYPLLAGAIARALKQQIMLVDSAQNCARAVEETLDRQSLRAKSPNRGE